MRNRQLGFTLIELMIVVAIIGILAAVAIPAFENYYRDSADNACAIQTKSFTNSYNLANQTNKPLPTSVAGACTTAATISGATISATAKTPGSKTTTCTILTSVCTTS